MYLTTILKCESAFYSYYHNTSINFADIIIYKVKMPGMKITEEAKTSKEAMRDVRDKVRHYYFY